MNHFVQTDAPDGFVLSPHLTPAGLDDFVDQVVPLLQERGVLRTEYATTTLREDTSALPPVSAPVRPPATRGRLGLMTRSRPRTALAAQGWPGSAPWGPGAQPPGTTQVGAGDAHPLGQDAPAQQKAEQVATDAECQGRLQRGGHATRAISASVPPVQPGPN